MREYRVKRVDVNAYGDITEYLSEILNSSIKEGWKTQSMQFVNTGYFYGDYPKVIILQYKDD